MKIAALETRYAGVRFRSRAEARLAVFLDALDVKWEYEKEGYALPSGNYLPDFWLPHIRTFVEVKGEEPTEAEQQKCRELSLGTGCGVLVSFGLHCPDGSYGHGESMVMFRGGNGCWDHAYWWCECRRCGFIGAEFEGRSARLPCDCEPSCCDKDYNYDSPRLRRAYRAALSERFGT